MQEHTIAAYRFNGMADCVSQVQNGPQSVLTLVCTDHTCLNGASALQRITQCLGIQSQQL
ncbi:hypothetical protein D3C80_1716640 [compost metagenome]